MVAKKRVIVAHPDRRVRDELRPQLPGTDLVLVGSVDELVSITDKSCAGILVACCLNKPLDGVVVGSLLRDGEAGSFTGVAVGLACCAAHRDEFREYGIPATCDQALSCQVLLDHIGELD